MIGKHSDISPPPGFMSTAAAVYVLANTATAQQTFSSQQCSALQASYGVSLSSSNIPDILGAQLSFDRPGFRRVPDRDRYWYKRAQRKTAEFLDFSQVSIQRPIAVQSTVSSGN